MSSDAWQPRVGARVRVTADPKAPPDAAPPPPGTWMVLSRAPDGPAWWWLLAVDTASHEWCDTHRAESSSHCVTRPNQRLAPINRIRI